MSCGYGRRGPGLPPVIVGAAALSLAGAPALANDMGGIALVLFGPVWLVVGLVALVLDGIAIAGLASTARKLGAGELDGERAASRLRRSTNVTAAAVIATVATLLVFAYMTWKASPDGDQALATVLLNGPLVAVTLGTLIYARLTRARLSGLAAPAARSPAERPDIGETLATKIDDVEDGSVVKVVGVLRYVDEPLEAPLTGRPCACFRVTVLGRDPGDPSDDEAGDGRESYRGLSDFAVDDGTGEALVSTRRIRLALDGHEAVRGSELDLEEPAVRRCLLALGLDLEDLPDALRLGEAVLQEDEEVAVLGVGYWISIGDGPGEEHEELELEAPEGDRLVVSDDPDDRA